MAGRVLIHDSVVTNRILLRSRLSMACYTVLQADSLSDMRRQTRDQLPDVMIIDLDRDPDAVMAFLGSRPRRNSNESVPVLLLATSPSAELRRAALRAGATEIVARHSQDTLLLATLRSVMRDRAAEAEETGLHDDIGLIPATGFAEGADPPASPGEVVLIDATAGPGRSRARALATHVAARIVALSPEHALATAADRPVDTFVVRAEPACSQDALGLLTDLRSRAVCRSAGIVFVSEPDRRDSARAAQTAALALDLGANEVMTEGFDPAELGLRIARQVRRTRMRQALDRYLRTGLRLAAEDPLTGLYNRRLALPRLADMIARARQSASSLAVLLVDLDRFKSVNDRFGHSAGDSVLVEVAARLREVSGRQDLVARLGGEEFLIVLPDTGAPAAALQAGRIRMALRDRPIVAPGSPALIRVTASIGISAFDPTGLSAQSVSAQALIDRADRALYVAKSDGRDQITMDRTAA